MRDLPGIRFKKSKFIVRWKSGL